MLGIEPFKRKLFLFVYDSAIGEIETINHLSVNYFLFVCDSETGGIVVIGSKCFAQQS